MTYKDEYKHFAKDEKKSEKTTKKKGNSVEL